MDYPGLRFSLLATTATLATLLLVNTALAVPGVRWMRQADVASAGWSPDRLDAANAFDSLGEAHYRARQYDAALVSNRESLRLDPTNRNAAATVERIRALRAGQ